MFRRVGERVRLKDYDPLSPQDVWRFYNKPYRWAFALVRPVKFQFAMAFVLVFVIAIMALLPGIFAGYFVEEVLVKGDHTHIWLYLGLLFGIPAARGCFVFLMRWLFEYSSQHVELRTRDAMYQHLQKLDQSFYAKTPTGTIMAYLTGDLDMVRFFLAWAGYFAIEQLFTFFAGAMYLFFLNWKLALATMVVLPPLYFFSRRLENKLTPVWQNIRRQFEDLNSVVQENISGNRVIRAFVRKDYETARFEKENLAYADMNNEAADVRAQFIPILDGLSSFMSIPVLLLGGILTIQGQMDLRELITFNSLLFVLTNPTRMMGWMINDLKHFASCANKLIEMFMTKTDIVSPEDIDLTEEPDKKESELLTAAKSSPRQQNFDRKRDLDNEDRITRRWDGAYILPRKPAKEKSFRGYRAEDKPFTLAEYQRRSVLQVAEVGIDDLVLRHLQEQPVTKTKLEGNVRFEHVSYSYDKKGKSVLALKDIDFEAKAGQTIGIIGVTGSGKTSLVELISRLDDPTKGRILLDGIDLRTFSLPELRRSIGVVTQDVFLFSDTVEGNIAFVDPQLGEESVHYAARVAVADQFIEKMSDSYETIIGERGVGLSGGQRQRISLARAVAGDPAILILDDTTSAVDMNTDTQIRLNLEANMAAKTVFIIAQRISSIRNADLILVLDKGEIIERGTHEELLAAAGAYKEIYEVQVGDQREALAILQGMKEGE